MADNNGRDQKILCVPKNDPLLNFIEILDQVPPYILKEITHFFETYKNLEGKSVTVIGWKSLKEAVNILNETKFRYLEQKNKEDFPDAKKYILRRTEIIGNL